MFYNSYSINLDDIFIILSHNFFIVIYFFLKVMLQNCDLTMHAPKTVVSNHS